MLYRPMFGNARKDVLAGMLLGTTYTMLDSNSLVKEATALTMGLFFFGLGVYNRNRNEVAEVAFTGFGAGVCFSAFAKMLTGCHRLGQACQNSILSSIKMSDDPWKQQWMEQNLILLISAIFFFVGYRNRHSLGGMAIIFIGVGLVMARNVQDLIVAYHNLHKPG